MSWEPLKKALAEFDSILRQLNVKIGKDAPISPQIETVREFLQDHTSLSESELLAKWNNSDFKRFYDAAIVVRRLTEAVVGLRDQAEGALRQCLKKVVSGSLTQDFTPQQAKDFLYEFEIAHHLQNAGFTVVLREPDVVVSGNGLSSELGMACKYPSSAAQIHDHLSKGYKQIAKQDLDGCVVIGLDLITIKESFDSPPKYLDFRQGDRDPLDVANEIVSGAAVNLVQQHNQDYPSEHPVDGAILTFSVSGILGSPAGITSVTAWAVQCDAANPRIADIGRIVDAVKAL